MKKRVAFVVQRYGLQVNGGAETHCRQLVEHMRDEWDVEVLTSCARDYDYRFDNDFEPGVQTIDGIQVRRFRIDYLRSEPEVFSELDAKVLARRASDDEEQLWLKEIGPFSSDLIAYVAQNRDRYDLFIFFTYLYSTTTLVLPLVRDRAVLVPTAHDEPPLQARYFDTFFSLPFRLAVNTEAELELLEQRSRSALCPALVVGVGFDQPPAPAIDVENRYGLTDYFVYVGRVQKEKNCDELFEFYLSLPPELRRAHPLVLIGSAGMPVPEDETIVHLGYVEEAAKVAVMSKARALIMPSVFESLSMAVLESWMNGVPVIVNGKSPVLRAHVQASGGGLMYASRREFRQAVAWFSEPANADAVGKMVASGRRYVQEHYDWSVIVDKYRNLFADASADRPRKKAAFVVQRCGKEVNGGAEVHCFKVAQRMSRYWDVEVLTTTALDYMSWENHFQEGIEVVDGVKVRRFRVAEPRNKVKFDRLSDELSANVDGATTERQVEWMKLQGPWSPDMTSYIESHRDEYEVFFFFTYLYATTWFNLPIVADKAVLLPLAHDEWTIYLNMWNGFFELPGHFIFNTPEEKEFLSRRFPEAKLEGPVVGVAIERPEDIDPLRFRKEYDIEEDFLLYVGRVDPSKGCEELFDFFIRAREDNLGPARLVLLGQPVMAIPDHPDIVSLGFVSEQTKWDALAACQALVMPSPQESLSMVLLEAWTVAKPVIVNARCDVLVGQCRRANGGLWYANHVEFGSVLHRLCDGACAHVLGLQGQAYEKRYYDWHRIEQAFLEVAAGTGRYDRASTI